MKKALLALAVAAAASSGYAQGVITFYNNAIPINGRTITPPATAAAGATTYRAGVFRPDGTGAGDGFTAGLFLASDAGNPAATALATTTFRLNNTFEVFLAPQDVTVQGVPVGSTANFIVRAWQTGSTFAASTIRGESTPWTSEALGGTVPGNPPAANATMSGFMGITMVPEPSTLALGAIGMGALMLRRRK
jgi:hypothetical protein